MAEKGGSGESRVPNYCRITMKLRDEDQFVERFSGNITATGVFIQTKKPRPVGTIVSLFAQLKTGEHLFAATSVVKLSRPAGEAHSGQLPGMSLQFLDVHPRDKEWLQGILERGDEEDDVEIEVSDPLAGD